jgi:hypothetical protein
VVPVYKEETKLKIAKWWDFLEKKLLDAWITELLDINRINIWAWISSNNGKYILLLIVFLMFLLVKFIL